MKRLITLVLCCLPALGVMAQTVDLTQSDWFIRGGFSRNWTTSLPASGDPEWTKVDALKGERALVIRDLQLRAQEPAIGWSLFKREAETFTIIIPFESTFSLIAISDPALYFAHIGHNWAVYVNGVLARSEFRVGLFDRFVESSMFGTLLPIGRGILQPGTNIIAVRISGPPNDNQFGLTLRSPYLMGSYRELSELNNQYLDVALIGIYLIFGLYTLILYFLRAKDREYLFFSLATICLTVYLASRTLLFANFIGDSNIVRRVEMVSMFLVMPFFFAFFDMLIKHRIGRVTKIYSLIIFIMIMASFFFRLEPFQNVWRVAIPFVLVYYLVFVIGLAVFRDLFKQLRNRGGKGWKALLRAFWRFMSESDAGKIIGGALVIIVAVVFDILRVVSGYNMLYTKYAFVVFLLGAAAMLAGRFINIYHSLETLNAGLELKVEERTAALAAAAQEQMAINQKIAQSNQELRAAMEEAERDMKVAISVQKGFFPGVAPTISGWDIALATEVASGISGDFYDFYQKSGRLEGVLIGSVSGQGIASGLITVLTRSVFYRKFSENSGRDLSSIMFQINKELVRELASVDNDVRCALLRLKNNAVEYANAANADILILRSGTPSFEPLVPAEKSDFYAPPFGRNQLEQDVRVFDFELNSGDILLLHSTYLLNARNAKGEAYGMGRLMASLRRADMENSQSLLSSVMIDFRSFMSGSKRQDDTTVVVLRKL